MAVMAYRTKDGRGDFGFSIEFQPDTGWRVYIVFEPFHQGLDDGPELPNTSIDSHGRSYVDWSSNLNSFGEARIVAELWAELVHEQLRANLNVKTARERGIAVREGVGGRRHGRSIRRTKKNISRKKGEIKRQVDPALPVSIYLEDGQEATVRSVLSALKELADELGFELIPESPPEYGSFLQRLRARASDPNTQQEVYERLIKLERAAEVRLLAVPESQANMQNAQGLAAIIESLKGERAAVIQLGPLIVVKAPRPDCESAILCRTLTPKELRMLEADPGLLTDPIALTARLTAPGEHKQIEEAQ
jgi:hypothetical protein